MPQRELHIILQEQYKSKKKKKEKYESASSPQIKKNDILGRHAMMT